MTGISYPLVSCLLHTKTGQHSLPPMYMTTGTPPRFTRYHDEPIGPGTHGNLKFIKIHKFIKITVNVC